MRGRGGKTEGKAARQAHVLDKRSPKRKKQAHIRGGGRETGKWYAPLLRWNGAAKWCRQGTPKGHQYKQMLGQLAYELRQLKRSRRSPVLAARVSDSKRELRLPVKMDCLASSFVRLKKSASVISLTCAHGQRESMKHEPPYAQSKVYSQDQAAVTCRLVAMGISGHQWRLVCVRHACKRLPTFLGMRKQFACASARIAAASSLPAAKSIWMRPVTAGKGIASTVIAWNPTHMCSCAAQAASLIALALLRSSDMLGLLKSTRLQGEEMGGGAHIGLLGVGCALTVHLP